MQGFFFEYKFMNFNKSLNYFAILCLALIVSSFFMPFYESWLSEYNSITENEFCVFRINRSDYQEFDTIIYNGFGSLFAISNVVISLILVCGIFYFPRNLVAAIVSTLFMFVCLLLVYVGCSAGFGAPFGDSMHYGFYVFVVAESVLIVLSFVKFAVVRMVKLKTDFSEGSS